MSKNLVNLGLVLLVEFRCGKEDDPGEDEEGQHVEPGTNVGQEPEGETELDGVNHVLDKKETTKFRGHLVDGPGDTGGHVGDGLGGDRHWHGLHHGQGVGPGLGLLHHHHDVAVGLDTWVYISKDSGAGGGWKVKDKS